MRAVFEATERIDAFGPQQFAQQIHEAGAANAFGRAAADDLQLGGAVGSEGDFLNRAGETGHTAGNFSTFERGSGGTGCSENFVPIAENKFRVRPNVHHAGRQRFLARYKSTADMHAAAACFHATR